MSATEQWRVAVIEEAEDCWVFRFDNNVADWHMQLGMPSRAMADSVAQDIRMCMLLGLLTVDTAKGRALELYVASVIREWAHRHADAL